jgi:hypothetical protein
MVLRPLQNSFLFSFLNDTAAGRFIEKNSGSIILTNQDYDSQGKYARWAKVLAVGPKVTDFRTGDIVLIEALQWTKEIRFQGKSFWKSDSSKVIAITQDESAAYTYRY